MRQEVAALGTVDLDVLVVGGGIVGASVARDAASRGLLVGLVDRADFSSGASANCLKIVHGGLRYLQHLDLKRVRESAAERSMWLRNAPHLIEPLPIVVPTYRNQFPSRSLLSAALAMNDLVSFDRNHEVITSRKIPAGQVLSRHECLSLVPELEGPQLNGGILFYDALMYSPERLVMEVLAAAQADGAMLANYLEFGEPILRGTRIIGARLLDRIGGVSIDVRTRWIVNATGSMVRSVAERIVGCSPRTSPRYSLAMNFVTRATGHSVAFAIAGGTPDPDRIGRSGARQLFVVPWRNQTLIGTAHLHIPGEPKDFRLSEQQVEEFREEIDAASPSLPLIREDVALVHAGFLPVAEGGRRPGAVRLLKRHRVIDHAGEGVRGALSAISIKYTTARRLAEEIVDRIFRGMNRTPPPCGTARVPLPGASTGSPESLLRLARARWGAILEDAVLTHLVRMYGARFEEVITNAQSVPEWSTRVVAGSPTIRAQLVYGAAMEMAQTADDLLWRRTEIGPRGLVTPAAVETAQAILMQASSPTRPANSV